MTEKNVMRVRLIAGFILINIILILPGMQVDAASTKEITGINRYDYAFDVLERSNAARVKQGKSELSMDKDLIDAAMCRAAECAVIFDHTRPNGQNCFDMNPKIYAENLAEGQDSPQEVVDDWLASSGHRTNLLNGEYKSIGIGCFQYNNRLYWVQLFGYSKSVAVGEPSSGEAVYQIALTKSMKTKLISGAWTATDPLDSKVANVKLTGGKKKLTLTWSKKSGVTGYQVQISDKKSFDKAKTYTLTKSKKKLVIKKYNNKKLKSKKKYYVRIRAYLKTEVTSSGEAASSENVTGGEEISLTYSKWKTLNKKTK